MLDLIINKLECLDEKIIEVRLWICVREVGWI